MPTERRRLGQGGPEVPVLGYGAWPLSDQSRPEESVAIGVIHRALDLGVRLFDSADAYCLDSTEAHHNERLLRRALESYSGQADLSEVVVATKGGCVRPGGAWEKDLSASHLAEAIAGSRQALSGGSRPIQLWQLHSLRGIAEEDLDEILRPVCEAVEAGVVERVGLSNCTVGHLERAAAMLPKGVLATVQNEYNFWEREPERNGILDYCQAHGLAFLPYGALGGKHARTGGRRSLRDARLFPALNSVAKQHKASPEQVCLAWMLARWPCLVHIASARAMEHLEDSLGAGRLCLSAEDMSAIAADGPDAVASTA